MTTNPDIETDIPQEVLDFFRNLNRAVDKGDTIDLHDLYENQFDLLTKKYYVSGTQTRPWPSLRLKKVSDSFKNKNAEQIYSFLYYKNLFTDRAVKQPDARSSWATFTDLFDTISAGDCDLPAWLLWDIFDEFVFQMTFVYQKRFSGLTEWSVAETMRLVDYAIETSNVAEVMKKADEVDELTKEGNTKVLSGFFAVITKAKVNVLLGDYYAALSDLEILDIHGAGRNTLQKVSPANISLLFNIGFSYLMIHRYDDASTSLRRCATVKASGRKFSERLQLDAAYMYVCARVLGGMQVSNISTFIDPRKAAAFDDDKESLRMGDEERFRDVFDRCSPKFLSVPPLSTSVKGTEGKELQARIFRRAVQQQQQIIKLRGYFGVYQNTNMSLLQTLLETEDGYPPLIALKMRSRQLVHDGTNAKLLSGTYRVSAQFDCIVSDDNVEVVPCTNYGGTEGRFLTKIKALQRSQQKHKTKQQQTRPRKEQEGKAQGDRRRPAGQYRNNRNDLNANNAAGGRLQQARRYPNRQSTAATMPTSNLFNRNETS